MNNPESSMIVASRRDLPTFEFNTTAKEAKALALETAALIGKVADGSGKVLAVRAQVELKRVLNSIEKARKELKEPLLNAGRQLDNLCASESLELEKEFGRVSNLVKEFDDGERRRVLEEERLQREELARIEAAKQAELKCIADEQARVEREAREAQERAEQLARDATSKQQRAEAEAARIEAERQTKAAQEQAAAAAAQTAAVEEKAGDAAYCAAKPIAISKVAGQRLSTNWNIIVEQPFVLAKFHPDLVEIKPRLADIKAALNEGREIKGIKATREHVSGVRLPAEAKAIDV